jgi:transketolase
MKAVIQTARSQPCQLHLGKAGEPNIDADLPDVELGRWLQVRPANTGRSLLSTGATLGTAMPRLDAQQYQGFAPHSLPHWSIASNLHQAVTVLKFDGVHALEDHLIDGGSGSWVLESSSATPHSLARMRVHTLSAVLYGTVRSQAMLNALGGLSDIPPA